MSAANDAFLERFPVTVRDAATNWLPSPWSWLLQGLIAVVAVLAIFGSLFAVLTLIERKALGRVQNRPGPNRTGPWGVLQPMADGIKMLTKEDIVPREADQVLHFLAPVAMLAMSLMTFAVIPFGRNLVPVELDASVLYFFAAGAATELAVFMAGWGSRNKYALLAAMRSLQAAGYEARVVFYFDN
jgi:NADH-quinone oxidoreductase subunit H